MSIFFNKKLFFCYLSILILIMIDNLIFDPKKQIWINLELYFSRYEISNFRNFSRIFLFLFMNLI